MEKTTLNRIENTVGKALVDLWGGNYENKKDKAKARKLLQDILNAPCTGICVIEQPGELSCAHREMTIGEALEMLPGAMQLVTRILSVAKGIRAKRSI